MYNFNGTWNLKDYVEFLHRRFAVATFDELVQLLENEVSSIINGGLSDNKSWMGILLSSVSIGRQDKKVNSKELEMVRAIITNIEVEDLNQLVEKNFSLDFALGFLKLLDKNPDICLNFLHMVFCLVYADGKCTAENRESIEKIASVIELSVGMMIIALKANMGKKFEITNVDAFISAQSESKEE